MDVIFLDFSRAFDSVNHRHLVSKLVHLGVAAELVNWIAAFLSGRKQRVVVDGHSSSWSNVTSGVPQGSRLSPLLFSVFVSDIHQGTHCKMLKYADDIKMYLPVKSEEDRRLLQSDLNKIILWCEKWDLSLNTQKCHVLHIGKNNKLFAYYLNNDALETVNEERDLGVFITRTLNVSNQCNSVASKANQIAGFLGRHLPKLDPAEFKCLYTTIIRPGVEFASTAWAPWLQQDIKRLESVQRRATKRLTKLYRLDYKSRLKILQLPKLSDRRKRGMLIDMFKIVNSFWNVPSDSYFSLKKSVTRGHKYAITKPKFRMKCRQTFFSCAIVNDWNALPSSIFDNCNNVNLFKNRLDRLLFSS